MEPKKDERSVRESSVIGQDSLSHLIILLSTFANLLKADKRCQNFFFQSVSLSSFGLEIRSGGALGWECREVMLREGEGIAFRRHAIKYPTTNPPLRDRQGGRGGGYWMGGERKARGEFGSASSPRLPSAFLLPILIQQQPQ